MVGEAVGVHAEEGRTIDRRTIERRFRWEGGWDQAERSESRARKASWSADTTRRDVDGRGGDEEEGGGRRVADLRTGVAVGGGRG